MKTMIRTVLLLVLLAALFLPSTVYARGLLDDQVVFGGSYTLKSGETLNGSLIVLGGVATIQEGSTVTGDIVLMGGSCSVSGEVQGDVVAIGGLLELTDTATVLGDVAVIGAHLSKAIGAVVEGSIVEPNNVPLNLDFVRGVELPGFRLGFNPVFSAGWLLLRSVLWAALAVLVVLFLPNQVSRVAKTATSQAPVSGGVGLLTAVLLPAVIVLFAITICLIPAAVLLAVIAVIVCAFGIISLGYEVGKRLAGLSNQNWAPSLSAGLGTFILILVVDGIGMIPCIGWIVPLVVWMVGCGAVLLTRFGSQPYPSEVAAIARTTEPPLPAIAEESASQTSGDSSGPSIT